MKNKEKALIVKIEQARLVIRKKAPFLSYVLKHYPIYFDREMKTAATNGSAIIFGEDFLQGLSNEETVFILLHELLHIMLEHPFRKGERHLKRFNVACDIVVNDILESYGFGNGKLNPIFGAYFNIDGTKNIVEYIYRVLPENIEEELFDSHDMWKQADEKDAEKIKDILASAGSQGYDNSMIEKHRRDIVETSNKSKTNWKAVLKPYVRPRIYDYSYARTDHRFQEVLLPAYQQDEQALSTIWFLVDVSGSMSRDQVSSVFSELSGVLAQLRHVAGLISFFSNIVTEPQEFRNVSELRKAFDGIESTGGTSFHIIFETYKQVFQNRQPLTAIVIITDGYAEFPPRSHIPSVPILWVINNYDVDPPFGRTIHI